MPKIDLYSEDEFTRRRFANNIQALGQSGKDIVPDIIQALDDLKGNDEANRETVVRSLRFLALDLREGQAVNSITALFTRLAEDTTENARIREQAETGLRVLSNRHASSIKRGPFGHGL